MDGNSRYLTAEKHLSKSYIFFCKEEICMAMTNKASIELVIQNRKFLDYLKQYQFKEL